MKELRKCKGDKCGKPLPNGNSLVSQTARTLGYCRYCYKGNYPNRNQSRGPVLRASSGEGLLSSYQRVFLEKAGFNTELWSPEFRAEMEDYWRARERKEVNI
jgi:threonine dehydrogenase-like Zn-dependent dehydrogenase